LAAEEIPATKDDLTPEWLMRCLGEAGMLGEARIRSLRSELVGEGEGFMGQVIRLHLEFEGTETEIPSSLIAKLPTTVLENRAVGELLGAYEREILFYASFAPRLAVHTPRAYGSVMEGTQTSERDVEGAAMMEKFPLWLIRGMMNLVTWIVSRRRRRYVLLIEDLGDRSIGDQVSGCSSKEAGEVLRDIARVHAQFWRSPELQKSYWLRAQNLNPRTLHSVFLKNRLGFAKRFETSAPPQFEESLRWLEEKAIELLQTFSLAAPETLLHGDLRLDNLGFSRDPDSGKDSVIFLDWQLASRGPGSYDVAYFLSGALPREVPQEIVLELVQGYHEALLAEGIEEYPFEACLRDYQRGLLSVLHRISSTDSMEFGNERGVKLIAIWLERTLSRLEGVDYDALLTT
jgi:hypothetical protein